MRSVICDIQVAVISVVAYTLVALTIICGSVFGEL